MDELFNIESVIGEAAAIIGLQFKVEAEFIREDQIKYHQFPKKPPVKVKKAAPVEGDEEAPTKIATIQDDSS